MKTYPCTYWTKQLENGLGITLATGHEQDRSGAHKTRLILDTFEVSTTIELSFDELQELATETQLLADKLRKLIQKEP